MWEVILSIAGFDPSAGGGILRDSFVIRDFRFFPQGVITANTVQNSKGVFKVYYQPPNFIIDQIKKLLFDFPIIGIKIGLPHRSKNFNEQLLSLLKSFGGPIVFDPVLRPTKGIYFVKNVKNIVPLFYLADIITPNYKEFIEIYKSLFGKLKNLKSAIKNFCRFFNTNLVVKGIKEKNYSIDLLFDLNEGRFYIFKYKKFPFEVRGTGCTYSSALTCLLAKGFSLKDSVSYAGKYVQKYVKYRLPWAKSILYAW